MRRAEVRDVELAVPLDETTRGPGRCDPPDAFMGETRLGLRWTDDRGDVVRLVAAFVDREGRVTSYNDLRGSATNVYASGPGTSILLHLGRGTALVRNEGGGLGTGYILPLEDALDAPVLDVPRRWIEQLRERCASDV